MMEVPDAPWVKETEATGYYSWGQKTYYEDECESCYVYEDERLEEDDDGAI